SEALEGTLVQQEGVTVARREGVEPQVSAVFGEVSQGAGDSGFGELGQGVLQRRAARGGDRGAVWHERLFLRRRFADGWSTWGDREGGVAGVGAAAGAGTAAGLGVPLLTSVGGQVFPAVAAVGWRFAGSVGASQLALRDDEMIEAGGADRLALQAIDA